MSRLNQTLIIILAIQIAIGAYTFWPRSTAAEAGQPLLPDLTADDVVEITLTAGDLGTGGEEENLTLAKQADGWVLPDAGDFPVDDQKIPPLLEKLAAVESGRLVTETEGSQARLQVADDAFNRRIQLRREDGRTDTLYLGSSAGVGATHVRVNNQPQVYLTGEIDAFEANVQASNWIDTLYFTVPQTATTGITLENENGTFEFERVGEEWMMVGLAEGEELNPDGVTALLNQTHSIRMTEPVGLLSEAGSVFAEPIATVTIEADGQTYRLLVGPQDETDSSYLVSASTSPYHVRVSQFTGDNIVTKTRDDFLIAPREEGTAGEADEEESIE